MIEWLEALLPVLTPSATVALIVTTFFTGRWIKCQTEATRSATDEAIKANKETYYSRMLEWASGEPGLKRRSAIFALVVIAEEWGEDRHRNEIISLFRDLAAQEDAPHRVSDEASLPVRGVLETWDRHGVGPRAALVGVMDQRFAPKSLWDRIKHAVWLWRAERRSVEPSVLVRDAQAASVLGDELARKAGNKLRSSGCDVIESGSHASVLSRGEPIRWIRGGDAEWDTLPSRVNRVSWSWGIYLIGNGGLSMGLHIRAEFSDVAPKGEWKVDSLIQEKVDGGNPVMWRWRSDGRRWVSHQDVSDEVEAAGTATLNRLLAVVLADQRRAFGWERVHDDAP